MGPQVAYFMPQILIEMDLHGPDIDARAPRSRASARTCCSAAARTSPGRRPRPARTSSTPSPRSSASPTAPSRTCSRRTTSTRASAGRWRSSRACNNITPNPGDPSPPETYTLEAQRTVHGIVYKRGTVDGQPVAFARQRSTYFHEADSARAFSALNRPSKVQNVEDFQQVDVQDQLHLQLVLRGRPGHRLLQLRRQPGARRRAPTPTSPTGAPASTTGRAGRTTFTDGRLHAVRRAPAGDQPGLHHLLEQQAGARLRRRRRPVGLRPALPLASRSTRRSTSASPAPAR